MPLQKNHPRLHFDPHRGEGDAPSRMRLRHWCYEMLAGPQGVDARASIAEATRLACRGADVGQRSREVTEAIAQALKTVAGDIHAVAIEFGYDPTAHEHTREACVNICLSRVAAAAGTFCSVRETVSQIEDLVATMLRAVRLTSEAQAVTALSLSMIERGRCDYDVISALRDEVMPETAAIIDAMWGRDAGDWSAWEMPEHLKARGR